MKNSLLSPRGWILGQSVMMLAVVLLGVVFHGQWPSAVGFVCGWLLFVTAAVVGIAGVRALGQNRTPSPEPKADATLVERGIYAHIRHPLYTSVLLAGVSWALLWQSAPALAAAVAQAFFFNAKARLEERLLQKKYPAYAAYRGGTWHFIPWLY